MPITNQKKGKNLFNKFCSDLICLFLYQFVAQDVFDLLYKQIDLLWFSNMFAAARIIPFLK